ncbi:Biotin/lipoate A/B protein ligase [Peltigera leucophlebia]|nr:Biotin/lipoate A/B protein ligase [Peltigera leucophlebia]
MCRHWSRPAKGFITYEHEPQEVQLVRRRSGGGTVFHDHGNVNYCVICSTADFNRDKHAEMVAGVLRTYTPRARVNERHDIVLDQGNFQEDDRPDPADMHRTGFHREGTTPPPLKISGSAYKLTRLRSLHHGTCLLNSWNIDTISEYLRSPARPFLKARGVESVRSPIGNVFDEPGNGWKSLSADFQIRVAKAFAEMYEIDWKTVSKLLEGKANPRSSPESGYICGYIEDDVRELAEIRAGIEELKSLDWIYGQTPQFTVSSHPFENDDRERPPLPKELPSSARVFLTVRSGKILQSNVSISSDPRDVAEAEKFDSIIEGKMVHEIQSFENVLGPALCRDENSEFTALLSWLNRIFGNLGK